ncbi:MAG TPA: NRDE family protein, partial [Thermoanaerobaculia bacterium]|nr:NRDE family protein [Thermoanaerobaculia bacterium]
MCLIAIAFRASKFRLVIAANRDEDHDRPTLAAHFWTDAPNILGGRDALHGGSWLAMTRA